MKTLFMLLAIMTAGCASALTYNDRQTATMSPEARTKLKELEVVRVPVVSPSDEEIRKARLRFAEIDRAELAEMEARFHPVIKRETMAGVPIAVITPQHVAEENKGKRLLYIHGGGNMMGAATDRTGMLMANEMGLDAYAIEYRLAPEAKSPVALQECIAVYKELVSQFGASNIVGVAVSSGSAHMLGVLLDAHEHGLPMIAGIALFSPLVDLTDRGDSITSNNGRDFLAYENQMDKFFIAPYVGNQTKLDDPSISPLYGAYDSSFPATVIVTGTRDIVLSGSTRLHWKLRRANVPAELIVGEGMWHAYTSYPDIPESREARKATQDFLFAQLRRAAKQD